jgi:hypothetical protein
MVASSDLLTAIPLPEEVQQHSEPRVAERWFVAQGGVKAGPFSLVELQRMVRDGKLQADDMLLPEGAEKWVEAGSIPQLLRILQPHRFPDAERVRIQAALDRELPGTLPPWVTGISCETATDVAGSAS